MDFFRPSTYTPFFRRFTDEKGRELEETAALYQWVKTQQNAFKETPVTVGARVYEFLAAVSEPIRKPFIHALDDLITAEAAIWELPEPAFERMSLQQFVQYRNLLYAKQYFFTNQQVVLQQLHEALVRLLYGTARELPEIEDPSPFTIPLVFALPDPRLSVEQIFGTLTNGGYEDKGLFKTSSAQLYQNLCRASGRETENSTKVWKYPRASALPLDELVETYLGGTPFADLFLAPIPLKLAHEDRFHHMHIVGGTGAGKTTLIENLILHDIESDDPPSLVVIDPHGDLIQKIVRSDLGIEDRLVIIDPRDIQHPPALNVFALNQERMDTYDEATREQVTAGVIQTFDYLFSGLVGADLTAKQGVFFRYVARLLLSLPDTLGRNATIKDMIRLMEEPPKGSVATVPDEYRDAVRNLPEIPREFFQRDFASKTFAQTREQIRYRLQAIIENPTLARLFTSPETKVDIFSEINRGSIILVDTAKDFLKSGSANFGRIFVSLTLQAVLERAAIPARNRKDTFLIVDEAASFFDSNIDDLLTEARKYRCGCVFAHQYLDQASSSLRASLAANTGIKFASGLSSSDARAMAPDMRTTADFILDQPKLQFAAHIRNVTPHAVSIPLKPRPLDRFPRLSETAYEKLIDENRKRVWTPRLENVPKALDFSSPADPSEQGQGRHRFPPGAPRDEDISAKW